MNLAVYFKVAELYMQIIHDFPQIYVCMVFFLPFRLHANLTKGFGIMGPKEFFPLLDFAFMPKNALSSRWGLFKCKHVHKYTVNPWRGKAVMYFCGCLWSFLSVDEKHCGTLGCKGSTASLWLSTVWTTTFWGKSVLHASHYKLGSVKM